MKRVRRIIRKALCLSGRHKHVFDSDNAEMRASNGGLFAAHVYIGNAKCVCGSIQRSFIVGHFMGLGGESNVKKLTPELEAQIRAETWNVAEGRKAETA